MKKSNSKKILKKVQNIFFFITVITAIVIALICVITEIPYRELGNSIINDLKPQGVEEVWSAKNKLSKEHNKRNSSNSKTHDLKESSESKELEIEASESNSLIKKSENNGTVNIINDKNMIFDLKGELKKADIVEVIAEGEKSIKDIKSKDRFIIKYTSYGAELSFENGVLLKVNNIENK